VSISVRLFVSAQSLTEVIVVRLHTMERMPRWFQKVQSMPDFRLMRNGKVAFSMRFPDISGELVLALNKWKERL
jgi:hypothetical protein